MAKILFDFGAIMRSLTYLRQKFYVVPAIERKDGNCKNFSSLVLPRDAAMLARS